ncbi:MAG: hypothetical protein HGA38_02725 [Candidatus Moranbacteria bacterium]|nr:hypothetical protein [Candidatus Moranbacteria bacterium]NTW46254.1 hypothetical protein [Candidatus Moranbacteria bacterium]
MDGMDAERYSLLLDAARSRFDAVVSADAALDQKAGSLLGFGITVFTGYVFLVREDLEGVAFVASSAALLVIVIALAILIRINWPRRSYYSSVSFRQGVGEKYLVSDNASGLGAQLLSDLEAAMEKNVQLTEKKGSLYKTAVLLLVSGVVILALASWSGSASGGDKGVMKPTGKCSITRQYHGWFDRGHTRE